MDIEEKGVKLKLTIVDTPGFGDAVNNTEWYASDSPQSLMKSNQSRAAVSRKSCAVVVLRLRD